MGGGINNDIYACNFVDHDDYLKYGKNKIKYLVIQLFKLLVICDFFQRDLHDQHQAVIVYI